METLLRAVFGSYAFAMFQLHSSPAKTSYAVTDPYLLPTSYLIAIQNTLHAHSHLQRPSSGRPKVSATSRCWRHPSTLAVKVRRCDAAFHDFTGFINQKCFVHERHHPASWCRGGEPRASKIVGCAEVGLVFSVGCWSYWLFGEKNTPAGWEPRQGWRLRERGREENLGVDWRSYCG